MLTKSSIEKWHWTTVHFVTSCERCEACDCPTLGTPGNKAATVFEVSSRGWPVASTAFCDVTVYVYIVCLLKALVHVYTVSCAHTSDPVSLHCNYSLYNLAVEDRVCSFQWCCLKWVQRMTVQIFTRKETMCSRSVRSLVSNLSLP